MDILHSIILGIVQGITEFFPISSSGHLLLFKNFFQISDDGMFIEVLLHGGTLLSILVYYKNDILIEKDRIFKGNYNFIINLIIATLPAAIIGFLYKDEIESFFFNSSLDQSLLYISYSFLFTAIILILTKFIKNNNYINFSYFTSLCIGMAQIFALFPGVSRSGITIAAALFLGINKKNATKFSFMLAIPIITFAFIESIYTHHNKMLDDIIPILIGFFTSAIIGYYVILALVTIVKKKKMWLFGIYCLLISLSLIIYNTWNIQ